MSSSVNFRGNKYGISVKIAENASYEEIKRDIASRFKEAKKFLGKERLAICFEGQRLTEQQEEELVDIIQLNCGLQIVCIMDRDEEKKQRFSDALKQLEEKPSVKQPSDSFDISTGQFYKGHLRSGQFLEFEQSVIVIGDVNPGASIVSKGNIIVLGSLKGTAFAGASGRKNCFIVAMDMHPIQIRIADVFARASDRAEEKGGPVPRIAFVEDENIYIEPLNKSVLNDITL